MPNKKEDTLVGTPFYMAPEVINKCYDSQCDMWSIGIITYILLSGKPAFFGSNDEEIKKAVCEEELVFREDSWKQVSQIAKNFIMKLLDRDPTKRYTAA